MDDPFAVGMTGGAAGIGIARARRMRDGRYAAALTEGQSPSPAFAGPGSTQHHEMYNNAAGGGGVPPLPRGPGSPEYDLLEAAGMDAVGATGVNRGMSFNNRPAHADHLDLSWSKSQGSRSLGDPMTASTGEYTYTSPASESYASHYQLGFQGNSAVGGYPVLGLEVQPGVARSVGYGDAYGGYDEGVSASIGSPGSLLNLFSPTTASMQGVREMGMGVMMRLWRVTGRKRRIIGSEF
jgi:hypothetical protein